MQSTPFPPIGHGIVLYDGSCLLCSSSVRFIIHRDAKGYFLFAPLHAPDVERHLRERLEGQQLPDSLILLEAGKYYIKSRAALKIAQHLGFPWMLLAKIGMLFPIGFSDFLYDWIARNRYKWFGKQSTCSLPYPEERERFLYT